MAETNAVEKLLQQHGIPYKTNHVTITGVTQLFFQGPEGYHIEIGTYPPTRELANQQSAES